MTMLKLCHGQMSKHTSLTFGLFIAYCLPGFLTLCGIATQSDTVLIWLLGAQTTDPTVGGVLYVTAASVGIGMVLNAFRWIAIDTIHHRSGLPKPAWDDGLLPDRLDAFARLVEDHFRYYQFYGNTLLAGLLAYPMWRSHTDLSEWPLAPTDTAFVTIEVVLFLASRDALKRYYGRVSRLLGADGPL